MVFRENGEPLETAREDRGSAALKRLEELGRVPLRFIATFVLIKSHGHSWRRRAKELGVHPGTIGYQIRQVKLALEQLFSEEPIW